MIYFLQNKKIVVYLTKKSVRKPYRFLFQLLFTCCSFDVLFSDYNRSLLLNANMSVEDWIKTLGERIGYFHLHNNHGKQDIKGHWSQFRKWIFRQMQF